MADHQIIVLKEMWGQAKILCLWNVKGHWLLNPPLWRKQNSVYQVPFLCVRSIFINVLFIPISVSCHSSRLAPCSIQHDWHLDPSCVPVSRSNICETLLHIFQGTQVFHSEFLLCFSALHQNYRYRESSRWVCLCLNMKCAFIYLTSPWILMYFLQHRRAALA